MSINVFLSTVSDEFRAYRDQLCGDLTRHNVAVKVQEDFKGLGGDTLDKLDVYIAHCNAVVHLTGEMTGSAAHEREQQALLRKYPDLSAKLPPLGEALRQGTTISYTQWEAWLALYHGRLLLIAKAEPAAPRGPKFAPTDQSRAAQGVHLGRLELVRRYPDCTFRDEADLAKHIAYTAILDLLAKDIREKSEDERSKLELSRKIVPRLTFYPIPGANYVRGVEDNDTPDGAFSFSLRLNLTSVGKPFILTGFCATYMAPDGCYCYHHIPEVQINDVTVPLVRGSTFFKTPVYVTNGIAQVYYRCGLRPPHPKDVPEDCDYGDFHIRARVDWEESSVDIELFYRLKAGGILVPIEKPREPPILSDTVIDTLLQTARITESQAKKAKYIKAYERYHLVRFGPDVGRAYPAGDAEYRAFLIELLARASEAGI